MLHSGGRESKEAFPGGSPLNFCAHLFLRADLCFSLPLLFCVQHQAALELCADPVIQPLHETRDHGAADHNGLAPHKVIIEQLIENFHRCALSGELFRVVKNKNIAAVQFTVIVLPGVLFDRSEHLVGKLFPVINDRHMEG